MCAHEDKTALFSGRQLGLRSVRQQRDGRQQRGLKNSPHRLYPPFDLSAGFLPSRVSASKVSALGQ